VSSVIDTRSMFRHANAFNQDLSLWDMSNAFYRYEMFDYTPMADNVPFLPKLPPYSAQVVAAREQKQQEARAKGERKRAEAAARRAARRAS